MRVRHMRDIRSDVAAVREYAANQWHAVAYLVGGFIHHARLLVESAGMDFRGVAVDCHRRHAFDIGGE